MDGMTHFLIPTFTVGGRPRRVHVPALDEP